MNGFRKANGEYHGAGRAALPIALGAALLLLATLGSPLAAVTVDRVAALIDRQVLTVSEVSQMVEIRFFPRPAKQSDDDYRHDVLESLIDQTLRFRDVERFGAEDISKDVIEARMREIATRFPASTDFDAAIARAELTPDEVRAQVKRQLQVEAYIRERFSPLIFVSQDEVEAYYRGTWSEERKASGLPVQSLAEATETVRTRLKASRLQEEIKKWTEQLRSRANVDVYGWR